MREVPAGPAKTPVPWPLQTQAADHREPECDHFCRWLFAEVRGRAGPGVHLTQFPEGRRDRGIFVFPNDGTFQEYLHHGNTETLKNVISLCRLPPQITLQLEDHRESRPPYPRAIRSLQKIHVLTAERRPGCWQWLHSYTSQSPKRSQKFGGRVCARSQIVFRDQRDRAG